MLKPVTPPVQMDIMLTTDIVSLVTQIYLAKLVTPETPVPLVQKDIIMMLQMDVLSLVHLENMLKMVNVLFVMLNIIVQPVPIKPVVPLAQKILLNITDHVSLNAQMECIQKKENVNHAQKPVIV